MPHAIEMKDGKILTPFGIQDLLEAVSDYAGEELAREIESYIDTQDRHPDLAGNAAGKRLCQGQDRHQHQR